MPVERCYLKSRLGLVPNSQTQTICVKQHRGLMHMNKETIQETHIHHTKQLWSVESPHENHSMVDLTNICTSVELLHIVLCVLAFQTTTIFESCSLPGVPPMQRPPPHHMPALDDRPALTDSQRSASAVSLGTVDSVGAASEEGVRTEVEKLAGSLMEKIEGGKAIRANAKAMKRPAGSEAAATPTKAKAKATAKAKAAATPTKAKAKANAVTPPKPVKVASSLPYPGIPTKKCIPIEFKQFRIYTDMTSGGWRVKRMGEKTDKKFAFVVFWGS